MYRRLLTYILLFFAICLSAQRLEVTDFEELPMDLSARRQERLDNNSVPCALIKVQLLVDGALFRGSVMGDVRYEANTYWVYMAQGAKRLTINAPGFYTRTVEFSDFGINYVESSTTYSMIIESINSAQKSSWEIYQEALAEQARLDSLAKLEEKREQIEKTRQELYAKMEENQQKKKQAEQKAFADFENSLSCHGFVGYENQHACVDLGLSVLWSPEDVSTNLSKGLRCSWGELEKKMIYDWEDYSLCTNGDSEQLTKYKSGEITQLQPEDDLAHVDWGGTWRIPSKEEWQELIDSCKIEFVVIKGSKKLRVTGPNGNYITLSARLGMATGTTFIDGLYYWSSSLSEQTDKQALALSMPLKTQLLLIPIPRCYGLFIRPVCDKPTK